jgi:hypothetical protein
MGYDADDDDDDDDDDGGGGGGAGAGHDNDGGGDPAGDAGEIKFKTMLPPLKVDGGAQAPPQHEAPNEFIDLPDTFLKDHDATSPPDKKQITNQRETKVKKRKRYSNAAEEFEQMKQFELIDMKKKERRKRKRIQVKKTDVGLLDAKDRKEFAQIAKKIGERMKKAARTKREKKQPTSDSSDGEVKVGNNQHNI